MFVKPFKIKMTRLTRRELSKWANKTAPIEISTAAAMIQMTMKKIGHSDRNEAAE